MSGITYQKSRKIESWESLFLSWFLKFCGQSPHSLNNIFVSVSQMHILTVPMGRAQNTDLENGMVCYISIKTSRDISKWNYVYFADSALFGQFLDF